MCKIRYNIAFVHVRSLGWLCYGCKCKEQIARQYLFRSVAACNRCIITSAKDIMFSSLFVCLFVCLSVSSFAQKFGMDLREIFREGWQWTSEQMITNNRLDTGIIFQIRHHWEIRKVVSGHSFILHDSPDGGTGKMCLGRGMYCPNASS